VNRFLKRVCGNAVQPSTILASRLSNFGMALCLVLSNATSADDTEIYFTGVSSELPNVLFILDTSGSMAFEGSSGATRMAEMQTALEQFISTADLINLGVMTFAGHGENEYRNIQIQETVGPISDNRDDALTVVNNLNSDGGTPTLRALEYARRYFGGELRSEHWNDISPLFATPIKQECQQNHIVLITDGSPGRDIEIEDQLQNDLFGAQCLRQDVGGQAPPGDQNNGNCGAELARYMYTEDALDTVIGTNTIKTHTIGFNFDDPWLATLSSEITGGGGTHHSVSSIDELQEALSEIFIAVSSASIAAPTVSTDSYNESRHRDELFYSQFAPSKNVRWPGNIKKYRLSAGSIVDADDNPLIDPDTGVISPTSRSLWSGVADGESVGAGGFAGELPLYSQRYWYTDFDVIPDASEIIVPVRVSVASVDTLDNRNYLSAAALNAGSDAERDQLVSWALGADVPDNPTENHWYVADALHGTPQLLSYRSSVANDERTEVLYSATNLGVLHAIDAESGQEIWSYTPEEHLPNIKKYYDNEIAVDRVYGLDGEILINSTRTESTDYDYEVDKAHLYLTERRGGNRVYALDVTNGFNNTDPFRVMWKITGGTIGDPFADLAQTWSEPEIINVSYGCPDDCQERELLMFAGGYNPLYDDVNLDHTTVENNLPASGHGNAVYFVDPLTGDRVWSVGNGIQHTLDLPIEHSIPSTPIPIDTNLDGFVDLLYFVDLSGDVWRIDLSKKFSDGGVIHQSGGQIAALSPAGQSLRFFNPIDVSLSGLNISTSNFFLVTGSGMRNSPLHTEPDNNRLYSITDRWIQEAPYRKDPITNEKVTDYRYVKNSFGTYDIITADDSVLRDVSDTSSSTSVEYGFFKPLEPGEKALTPTSTRRSQVLASTYVPPGTGSGCEGVIGTSRLYLLSLPEGNNAFPEDLEGSYITIGEGIQGSGVLVDTGETDAPYLLFDKDPRSLEDVVSGTSIYRKFQRTGWVENDDYQ